MGSQGLVSLVSVQTSRRMPVMPSSFRAPIVGGFVSYVTPPSRISHRGRRPRLRKSVANRDKNACFHPAHSVKGVLMRTRSGTMLRGVLMLVSMVMVTVATSTMLAADITGKWKGELEGPDGTKITNTFTFKQ